MMQSFTTDTKNLKGNKMKLSEEQIKSIAEDLDMGLNVYIHTETNEIKTLIDLDSDLGTEGWEEDIKEIEENFKKYFQFEKMDSRDSFSVMRDFIETVTDERLKSYLESAISHGKPFRKFKDVIDRQGEYRQRWFDFKATSYMEFVKEQIELYNNKV